MKYQNNEIRIQPEILMRQTGREILTPFFLREEIYEGLKPFGIDVFPAGIPICKEEHYEGIPRTPEQARHTIGILLNDLSMDYPYGVLVKGLATINVGKALEHIHDVMGEEMASMAHYWDTMREGIPTVIFENGELESGE